MESLDLFIRTPVTLEGIVPPIRIGKILASVDALQIQEDKNFSVQERQLLCREFGMTENEIKKAFNY